MADVAGIGDEPGRVTPDLGRAGPGGCRTHQPLLLGDGKGRGLSGGDGESAGSTPLTPPVPWVLMGAHLPVDHIAHPGPLRPAFRSSGRGRGDRTSRTGRPGAPLPGRTRGGRAPPRAGSTHDPP